MNPNFLIALSFPFDSLVSVAVFAIVCSLPGLNRRIPNHAHNIRTRCVICRVQLLQVNNGGLGVAMAQKFLGGFQVPVAGAQFEHCRRVAQRMCRDAFACHPGIAQMVLDDA